MCSLAHARTKGLACRLRATPASSHASPVSSEAFTLLPATLVAASVLFVHAFVWYVFCCTVQSMFVCADVVACFVVCARDISAPCRTLATSTRCECVTRALWRRTVGDIIDAHQVREYVTTSIQAMLSFLMFFVRSRFDQA